jgi:hypothetical protein
MTLSGIEPSSYASQYTSVKRLVCHSIEKMEGKLAGSHMSTKLILVLVIDEEFPNNI